MNSQRSSPLFGTVPLRVATLHIPNVISMPSDWIQTSYAFPAEVQSAEGLFVKFKSSSRKVSWVTQSVKSPGDAFGSTTEHPNSLPEKSHTSTRTAWLFEARWKKWSFFVLTACWSFQFHQIVTSTWGDPPAAVMQAGGISPQLGPLGKAKQNKTLKHKPVQPSVVYVWRNSH